MPEDRKNTSGAETDGSPSTDAVDAIRVSAAEETPTNSGQSKIALSIEKANPVVLLLFMILIMVVALAAISLSGKGSSKPGIGSDDPVMAALKADLDARRSELNRQRMAMGLPPLEGASEPIEDIATRVKSDTDTLVGLAGSFQQMLGDKDAEISSRNSEVLRLEKLRQDVSMENSRLQTELNRALFATTEVDQLKKSIDSLQSQRDALSMELSDTRAKLAEAAGSVNADDYADLQRRYDEAIRSKAFFENRVNELEALLNKAELFAKSETELLPAAVELFRRLRKLEGMKDSDLTTEYSKLGDELGASVMHTLDFKTGSSKLSPEDMVHLENIAGNDVPDGDLTLIIGYASKTGDSVNNERLSSDRATAAAKHFSSMKREGQNVQAVYLGQTDRFSSEVPERNQICEVWRIRKK
jgi:outer membrane protein OmpA-like peptidoglycan-associated protein